MRVLISGGCKNGKSTMAQRLAVSQGKRFLYVATMRPHDEEDRARIRRHQAERAGMGFLTIECHRDIGALAASLPEGASVLLDSTTALLAEEMFGAKDAVDLEAPERVATGISALLAASGDIVIVSDFIHADGVCYGENTEAYRKGLAMLDRRLAGLCDAVIEMIMGLRVLHKGGDMVARWLAACDARFSDGDGPVYGAAGLCPLG